MAEERANESDTITTIIGAIGSLQLSSRTVYRVIRLFPNQVCTVYSRALHMTNRRVVCVCVV